MSAAGRATRRCLHQLQIAVATPEVHELVERIVNETNKRFARVENVRRFAILEKELDHDDGELTATQKVRRAMIEKKFARELAIIYQAEG
jgi:long-chain acyl-CoA synthetase